MKNIVLEALDISKDLAGFSVIDNVSIQIERNTIIAIKGKNGSGKSTLLKLFSGIYEPTNGKILRNTSRIGYIPEQFPEQIRFKVKEYLQLISSFHHRNVKITETTLMHYINTFGLEPFLDTPLKKCSKGTRQKVSIIQALINDPDLLLIDEPLTGLDPSSKEKLIELLSELKPNRSIIFTTHEKTMVEQLADQTFILQSGKLQKKDSYITKNIIKLKFHDSGVFKRLGILNAQINGDIAQFTVEHDKCDQVLLNLLNNHCSILEVRGER